MGGIGSGNRFQTAEKNTCEMSKRIDIRYLRRTGMLEPGYVGSLHWSIGGEPTGNISLRTGSDSIELIYRYRNHNGEDWRSVNEIVHFAYTRQNLGLETVVRMPALPS